MKVLEVIQDVETWHEFEMAAKMRGLQRGVNVGGKQVVWKDETVVIMQLDEWEEYEYRLQTHDWTHAMSDDHKAWQSGQRQMSEIKRLQSKCAEVDKARAEALFKKYADIGWGRAD